MVVFLRLFQIMLLVSWETEKFLMAVLALSKFLTVVGWTGGGGGGGGIWTLLLYRQVLGSLRLAWHLVDCIPVGFLEVGHPVHPCLPLPLPIDCSLHFLGHCHGL
jgi:hypothetical protein